MKKLTEQDAAVDGLPKIKLSAMGGGNAAELAALKEVIQEKDCEIAELKEQLAAVSASLAQAQADLQAA